MLAYQHGSGPMLLDTLWVKKKLKFALPRAGREIPSMRCRTHGPRSVLVVVVTLIVCHGQANRMLGRWMGIPIRCSAAESAVSTTDAIARRKTRPATATAAAQTAVLRENTMRRGRAA